MLSSLPKEHLLLLLIQVQVQELERWLSVSISKILVHQAWGPDFKSPEPTKTQTGLVPSAYSQHSRGRNRSTTTASRLARIARICSVNKANDQERHPEATWVLNMHVHTHSHETPAHTHDHNWKCMHACVCPKNKTKKSIINKTQMLLSFRSWKHYKSSMFYYISNLSNVTALPSLLKMCSKANLRQQLG